MLHYSGCFREAMDTNPTEDENAEWSFDLDDVSPKIFKLIEKWLHDQNLSDVRTERPSLSKFIDLRLLADELAVSTLQNEVLLELFQNVVQADSFRPANSDGFMRKRARGVLYAASLSIHEPTE